jgi:hydrogenase maturation protease
LKPVLVLCLGNEYLSDDGFGPAVAARLNTGSELPDYVEVLGAAVAGFNLLDHLAGRQRVLIVDTIRTGKSAPGYLHYFSLGELAPTHHLTTSHQISLPTALEFGRRLGLAMPAAVDVLAVEADDLETLREYLTPPVAKAVEQAVLSIGTWILENRVKEVPDNNGR